MVSEDKKKDMTIEDFKDILIYDYMEDILIKHGIKPEEALYYLYVEGYLEYGIDDKLHEEEMGTETSD